MRPNRNIRVGIILIVVAIIALFVVSRLGNRGTQVADNTTDANTVADNGTDNGVQTVSMQGSDVVFQARDFIPERTIITPDMFETARYRGDTPTPTTFVTDLPTQAVGFITARPLQRGTQLRTSDLIGHISKVGIAGAIRPGARAMVVPIVNKATLHDLVRIGDYVDIIAAFDQQESRAIVQNVRVLAVDVYGKDFPQVRIAMRGSNKAEPGGVGFGNAPSPVGAGGAPAGGAGAPAAAATPTPTPPPAGPPPAAPEPALILEVSPDQAAALSLAVASNSPLDYIIHPTTDNLGAPGTAVPGGIAPGGITTVRAVAITKPQLAPYADRIKRRGTTTTTARTRTVATGDAGGGMSRRAARGNLRDNFGGPQYPPNVTPPLGLGGPGLPPAQIQAPQAPKTYDIPIYADGKSVRIDTVRKPDDIADSSSY